MHPLWKDVVKELKNAYKRVTITTNGTLINREAAEFLVDQRVDEVYISVESSPLGHNNVENTFAVGDRPGNWEKIYDPAAGTGGFILRAFEVVKSKIDNLVKRDES